MKKIVIFISLFPLFFISCDKGNIFSKYHKLKDYNWDKDNIIVFEVPVEKTSDKYDIILAVRHTPQYPYANLQLNFTVYSPSGQERTKDYDLFLRNTDGSFKGEGMGDLYDIDFPLLKEVNLDEEGTYRFEVQSLMPKYTTPAIMEIGLKIKKSK